MEPTNKQAINTAHDERRPFCFMADWFIIPYYIDCLPKNEGARA